MLNIRGKSNFISNLKKLVLENPQHLVDLMCDVKLFKSKEPKNSMLFDLF